MSLKRAIKKNFWILLLGVAALVIGEITGRIGFGAAGFGCLFAFVHQIFKELNKRSDTDD
ncbi:MAG TPA: hypothetical protein ENK34_11710 [Rhodobacteraceae bacterium]|nr:hypothetical protein [Paracoccaceae bacterium]